MKIYKKKKRFIPESVPRLGEAGSKEIEISGKGSKREEGQKTGDYLR